MTTTTALKEVGTWNDDQDTYCYDCYERDLNKLHWLSDKNDNCIGILCKDCLTKRYNDGWRFDDIIKAGE